MPKLYYSPTSCGKASFIAACLTGVAMECEKVDIGAHKTASGKDFYAINPKGACPEAPSFRGGTVFLFSNYLVLFPRLTSLSLHCRQCSCSRS